MRTHLRVVHDREQPRQALRADQLYIPRIYVDELARAVDLPGKALAVYLAIRFEVAVKNASTIPLGNRILAERWGIHREAKRNALQALEQAGLIIVSRKPGASPLVTVL